MIGKKIILFVLIIVSQLALYNIAAGQVSVPDSDDIFTILHTNEPGEGQITLYQDASINVLVDKHKRINKTNLNGYRIQVFRGSGNEAREQANLASQQFVQTFPEFNSRQIYAIYESPYFKLRVGDYRSRNEAFELLYRVRKVFPNAYIVATAINFPLLSIESNPTESVVNE